MTRLVSLTLLRRFLAPSILLFLSACTSPTPYPAKQRLTITADAPARAIQVREHLSLRVMPATVAPPFDSLEFQHMVAPNEYRADYYANWAARPGDLITQQATTFLRDAAPFALVSGAASRASTTHALELHVNLLSADTRDRNAPRATVMFSAFLLDDTSADATIVFHQAYAATVRADDASPRALARAWSAALTSALSSLASDLDANLR